MFIRLQSAVPNRRGVFPGVFAMANGLRDAGLLSPTDEEQVRRWNAHGERTYTDPSTVLADCYDPAVNPGARSWFRDDATELLQMALRYTELLDRCEVPWTQLRTARPGRIVYEDPVQVVAVPFTYDEHWPLTPPRTA
ncbi:hypothetical protein [Brachybacterium vulturis]|uniref:hypothetical protein n=1 Tax=Brachybacterium vulturis TaxID=2017484 RepID=UPI001FE9C096|nr:hypothetical protein [Brachybacterium vulturis]